MHVLSRRRIGGFTRCMDTQRVTKSHFIKGIGDGKSNEQTEGAVFQERHYILSNVLSGAEYDGTDGDGSRSSKRD